MNLVLLASKGTQKSHFPLFELRQAFGGELALGENFIKIISGESNSLGTFLRIQSDIYIFIYLLFIYLLMHSYFKTPSIVFLF